MQSLNRAAIALSTTLVLAACSKAEAPKAEDKPEEKAEEAPKADETAPDTDTDSSGVTTENPVQPAEGADDASAEAPKADEAGA